MTRKALLILQGGGALGAYQCGAYKAIATMLRRADIELAGIAGASIGALNAAMIARHLDDPDAGAGALASFWREELAIQPQAFFPLPDWYHHCWNGLLSMLLCGNPGLSVPNYLAWGPWASAWRAKVAMHDTEPMERALAKHFGSYGPNPGRHPLLLVRAVNASTQEAAIFHSWRDAIGPRHLMASSSIPFLYPCTEIDGEAYWDGDFLPHTPLRDLLRVLLSRPGQGRETREYLVIIVDTICGQGRAPTSALDLLFQVQAAMLAPRGDLDEEYAVMNNRHVDFLEEYLSSNSTRPGSSLAKRLAREGEKGLHSHPCRLNVVRIRREKALPYEYVSRDLDYSMARVDRLIEQGYEHAARVLADAPALRDSGYQRREARLQY